MAEADKRSRKAHKGVLTREINNLGMLIVEEDEQAVTDKIEGLKVNFRKFDEVHQKYHVVLEEEDQIDESDEYYAQVQSKYVEAIASAKKWLVSRRPMLESKPKIGSDDANSVENVVGSALATMQSEFMSAVNIPKVEIEAFDGDPLKFHTFMAVFDEHVHNSRATDRMKLTRLIQYTSGKAKEAIRPCALQGDLGYSEAKAILERRFGNDHLIAERVIKNLKTGRTMKSSEDLQQLSDELTNAQATLSVMGKLKEVDTQSCIVEIARRLQPFMLNRWKRHVMEYKRNTTSYPDFPEFVKFVRQETDEATDPVYGHVKSKLVPDGKQAKVSSSFSTKVTESSRLPACVACKENHRLFYCLVFKSMKPVERRKLVKENKLCENCLLGNHRTSECRRPTVCTVPGCGQKHTKFIHVGFSSNSNGASQAMSQASNQVVSQVSNVNQSVNVDVTSTCTNSNSCVHVPTVAVCVNDQLDALALLDTASTSSFCTRKLASALGLQGNTVSYSLDTMSDVNQVKTTEVVKLKIMSKDGSEMLQMPYVLVVDQIPVKGSCVDVKSYAHLKDVPLTPSYEVDILIGQDCSEALLPLEVKRGSRGEPFAVRTLLGWSINGPSTYGTPVNQRIVSHFISATALEAKVQSLWDIENEGLSSVGKAWSPEDERVIKLWDSECKLVKGHYQLPVPWKPQADFPDNLLYAMSRLRSLKASLAKRNLSSKYDLEIQKLVNNGYAERIPDCEIHKTDKVWYLPHHVVISDSKPDKLRIVFDCAAKYHGQSLNDKSFQGPDLNNKLLSVLLRFREHGYAIMADVESMYHQVLIPPEDQDALRFLWHDGVGDIVHFRMTRHIFGGVWCSSSATYALRRTVSDCPEVCPIVADTILHSFYVDDCLRSVPTSRDALIVMHDTKAVLKQGGFNLTKFVINDATLLESIPVGDRAKEVKDIHSDTKSRALGIKWNVSSDCFYFDVSAKLMATADITRRVMLSSVASMFDPLGLVSPVLVTGKMLFQEATRLKLHWDEPIPASLSARWESWIQDLGNLGQCNVPRCVKPFEFNDACLELHHFSDASERAYGCCSYLRCSSRTGKIHVALLCSKSKLAPIKALTIPRLELQAALLAVKVDVMLKRELQLHLVASHFWVDSEVVLKYVHNECRHFQVFVANRVGEIRRVSEPSQWHHVAGNVNPADHISRGVNFQSMISSSWFKGPEFLHTHKASWKVDSYVPPLMADDPELKRSPCVVHATVSDDPHPIDVLLQHYSSWSRLKRAVAWWLRLVYVLKSKARCDPSLSVPELQAAEVLILKHVQRQAYGKEIQALSHSKPVGKSSYIGDLDPCLNAQGLLCVGGRLTHAALTDSCKHPPIIPYKSPIAVLIVRDIHSIAHLGTEWVLSLLRSKYWITKARTVVRRVKYSCVTCKKLYGATVVQKMADLPPERLEAGKPPFHYVGVDCFGPLLVKIGRARAKRYGCIFTCFATRAIHIEKLHSLDTDSFIQGFRRFVARRGYPAKVWSDNGTNFVGACRELGKALKELDRAKIHDYCVQLQVDWSFNPPHASHKGGIWERMIRTIRRVLTAVVTTSVLSDELLDTFLCEVESIINSRPLTKVSDDPKDPEALTPSHLLLLRQGSVLSPGIFLPNDVFRRRWRHVQFLACQFWKRWLREYLPLLQSRHKWDKLKRNIQVGDVVLVADQSTPRGLWPMGLVTHTEPGSDGLVRTVRIKTRSSHLLRPVTKVVLLEGS